ncbi:U32 family peptidase [Malacoplasma iowae]|uniref:U32 family peptidase n=1 Tax=Malacoplasma iowae 695 TaxID=1048830 RepID=A0A6P1LC23_MALIO|nr:U32 family peptidase [Malacoplasma iowae]QHG89727.1 U32 family peptidase [Malacoplasma iowae 695]WPL35480.1 U32 family peptidase [Malacoplasma iowae]VEU62543.1 Peptidase family U32 [Mycoplasmopsis fermentans]VEU72263.1 Peptidase family U32 [Malacoplasma iowae]
MEVYVKGFGLGFVMHSRWPMLSNFLKHADVKENKFDNLSYWEIKEDLRKYPNIIYEDNSGTHMLTGYFLSCIKRLKELYDSNIDGLIIDSLFMKDNQVIEIVKLFNQALSNLNNENEIIKLFDKQKDYVDHIVSEGFFGKMGDILHTLKNDNEQEGE